jgi:hypothetical protein
MDLDEDPRWRRRGHRRRRGSGSERWQGTCAREPVRHGERVGTINWKDTRRVGGNRRGQWRRRRGWIPAIVGEAMQGTRDATKWPLSSVVVMWCWLRGYEGVGRLESRCPRWDRRRWPGRNGVAALRCPSEEKEWPGSCARMMCSWNWGQFRWSSCGGVGRRWARARRRSGGRGGGVLRHRSGERKEECDQ